VDFAITAVRTGFGERRRVLIGRLAVDTRYQGRQIGSALIIDALRRSARAAPASFALIVDAKDDQAAAFYRRHGFVSFQSRPLSLFLPIATGSLASKHFLNHSGSGSIPGQWGHPD
jgi:predicted N-acetyltransferase YhbS